MVSNLNLIEFFIGFLIVFIVIFLVFIIYIICQFFKRILSGFTDKKDYRLFSDFKKTFDNETAINIDKKKLLLNRLKNRLIFDDYF